MPKVAEEALQGKLSKLSITQASIESVTEYCLFYYDDAPRVVAVWQQELHKAPAQRKLALVYLANHILQTAQRSKGQAAQQAFQGAFAQALPKALAHFLQQADDKSKKAVARLVDVWEQRRVLSSKHIKPLKDIVAAAAAGGAGTPAAAAAPAASSKPASDTNSDSTQLGVVGECLAATHKTSQATVAEEQRFNSSFKADLLQSGTLQEVTAASTRLRALTAALTAEKEARQATITALQAEIATQASSVATLQQRITQAQQQQQQLEARMGQLTQQMNDVLLQLQGQQPNGGADLWAGLGQQQQQTAAAAGGSPVAPEGSPQAPDMELENEEEEQRFMAAMSTNGAAAGQAAAVVSAGAISQAPGHQLMAALQGLPDHYQQKLGSDMQQLMASGLFTGALPLAAPAAPGVPAAPFQPQPQLLQPPPQQLQQVLLPGMAPPGMLGVASAAAAAAAVPAVPAAPAGMASYAVPGLPPQQGLLPSGVPAPYLAAPQYPGQAGGLGKAAADEEDEPYDPAED